MAEMAIAAIAALGVGGTAATGAVAGATALSALSGLATTVSIIGTLGAAFSAASASQNQAAEADIQAGQDKLESVQRQTVMKREMMRVLGENDVNFAAGGTSTGQGISLSAARQVRKRSNEELSIERNNSDFRVSLYRARANGLRRKAGSQLASGLLGSIGKGLNFGMDRMQLGLPGGGVT